MRRTVSGVHDLASHRTVKAATLSQHISLCDVLVYGSTFRLTIFAQKRRIADYVVKRSLEFRWQLDCLFEVVLDKLFEDCKSLIVL